jgi:hypothetical protein
MKTRCLLAVASLATLTFFFLAVSHVFSDSTPETGEAETAMSVSTDIESPHYSDQPYFELVRKYTIDDGEKVDYGAWKNSAEDMQLLDRQVAMIAAISPVSHPALFPTRARQRAYWINSYNTLILDAVLEYWPLESVREINISLSSRVVPGKGFFYDRKIVVGGKKTNLYKFEKEMLRNQKDPRLHFALNCGSESCPVLRAWEWTDEQLDEAAHEFVNNPQNVTVKNEKLYLSRIFKWYKKDFPKDVPTYLQRYADAHLARQLEVAKDGQYRTLYQTYDWSLNAGETTGGEPH